MLLTLLVDRDLAGIWNAAFAETPLRSFSGNRPREAIWSLFTKNVTRRVNVGSIVAIEPESSTRLRFTVETI